jgi:CMP-N-acetylneuraminic acid synthetase
MRVLAVITARGGSKGVPRKNIRILAGKPLLVWTAEAALAARRLARVIVSTEDDEIAEVARSAGVDVPIMRPRELAEDTTPTLPVLQHAVRELEATGDRFDAICLLQPTSPLRTAQMIDECVASLDASGADSVVTTLPVPHQYNPHWVYFGEARGELRPALGEREPIPRRQNLPPAWHREGSIYVTRRDVLVGGSLYGRRIVGYPVDPSRSVNIDTLHDWDRAEALLREPVH